MPRESLENKRIRAKKIIRLLKKNYPEAKCSLDYTTIHELMVATILSAQCTDERVNKTTPALFSKYKSITAYADAKITDLEETVYPTGFYKNKAQSIKKSAQQLIELYDGEMPKELSKLVKLAGVGRKTGSVVLGAGFGLAEGIVVDTHVGRINNHFKFTNHSDAVKIEKDLVKIIPKNDWILYSHLMIDHGRAICKARKPECKRCFLKELCPSHKA